MGQLYIVGIKTTGKVLGGVLIDHKKTVDLVLRIQQGDGQAFAELYETYFPYIYFNALKSTRSEEEARELTQEIFVNSYQHIGSLKDPKAFHSWIFTIAHNAAYQSGRAKEKERMRRITVGEDDHLDNLIDEKNEFIPHERLEEQEKQTVVMEFVNRLPRSQRDLIMMHYLEGLSVREIASITGERGNTISKRLFDARKALKQYLEKAGVETSKAVFSAGVVPVLTQALQKEMNATMTPQISKAVFSQVLDTLGGIPASPATTGVSSNVAGSSSTIVGKVIAVAVVVTLTAGAGTYAIWRRGSKPVLETSTLSSRETSPALVSEESTTTAAENPISSEEAADFTIEEDPEVPERVNTAVFDWVEDSSSPSVYLTNPSLVYPAGVFVSNSTVIADAGLYALDAQGNQIPVEIIAIDRIDFNRTGSYLLSCVAHDSNGEYASPVTLRVYIQ